MYTKYGIKYMMYTYVELPAIRHTTLASFLPKLSSQTVPVTPFLLTMILPDVFCDRDTVTMKITHDD